MSQAIKKPTIHLNPNIQWREKDRNVIKIMFSSKLDDKLAKLNTNNKTDTDNISSIHDLTISQYPELFPDMVN
ncbi:MAG: hypothetical protein ACI909_001324 [Planctomycetota bacterium]|jgi:hypothetical protein